MQVSFLEDIKTIDLDWFLLFQMISVFIKQTFVILLKSYSERDSQKKTKIMVPYLILLLPILNLVLPTHLVNRSYPSTTIFL